MRKLLIAATLVLGASLGGRLTAQEAQHTTGLTFLPNDVYNGLPKVGSLVGGSGGFPDSATLEYLFPPAGDQGRSLACASWASAYNKAYRLTTAGIRDTDQFNLQSPQFLYSMVTGENYHTYCKTGSYIQDNLAVLANYGSVPMSSLQFSPGSCPNPLSATRRPSFNSSAPFVTLDRNPRIAIPQIKQQITLGNPVIAGIYACQELQSPQRGPDGESYIRNLGPPCQDGHAILVVGYDNNRHALRLQNSWGTSWGTNGRAWIDEDVFAARYQEGYVDRGPNPAMNAQAPSGGAAPTGYDTPTPSGTTVAAAQPPSLPISLTPEILGNSVRASLGNKVLKTFTDKKTGQKREVRQRYVWLNLPSNYLQQIESVDYSFTDSTFNTTVPGKLDSPVFIGSWKGYGCDLDGAKVTVKLKGKTDSIESSYDLCLVSGQKPTS